MVAAWTLVPPFAVTARARRACRDDDGGFVLRSVPPGRQEPSAADVPAGSASHLAQRGEAGAETNAVEVACPLCGRNTAPGQAPASPQGTAPRRNRDLGAISPRQSSVTRTGQDRLGARRNSALVARLFTRTFARLPLGTSHQRSAVRLGKPARPIMASTARSASSPLRREAGAGVCDGVEKPRSARARSAVVVRHDDVVGVAVSGSAKRQLCAAVCNRLGEASVCSSTGWK